MWQLAAYLKPFVVVWAGLNLLDEVGWMIKLGRLVGASVAPVLRKDVDPDTMCALCDDVLSEFLKGKDGLQAVPCSWACLRIPACMAMCRSMQEASETSTKFPCIAAGYCLDDSDDDDIDADGHPTSHSGGFSLADIECTRGPLFSCEPKRYCRRQRQRGKFWHFTCDLRPGMGRWVGIQQAASKHTAALAAALVRPKRCGEVDAGPYCIAEPTGLGRVAEFVGVMLSLLFGGYRSVVAIETPGGDDDQQWLTFWLILVLTMLMERAVARVLLSKVPFYYELKLGILIWLLFWDGATVVYRRFLRKQLSRWSSYFAKLLHHHNQVGAQEQLRLLEEIGGDVISRQLRVFETRLTQNPWQRMSSIFQSKVMATTMMGGSLRQSQQDFDHRAPTADPQLSSIVRATMTSVQELQEFDDDDDQSNVASGASDHGSDNKEMDIPTLFSWEYDYTEQNDHRMGGLRKSTDPTEMLYLISKWILSAQGMQSMERAFKSNPRHGSNLSAAPNKEEQIDNDDAMALLIERAAAVLAFQPRYVNVHVIGTKEGPEGQLPAMDGNGKVDCYIKCRLVSRKNVVVEARPISSKTMTTTPSSQSSKSQTGSATTKTKPHDKKSVHRPYPEQGVVTRIAYQTLQPIWKEDLEIAIRGGSVDSSGSYRNSHARHTVLQVEAWDADVGKWGVALEIFQMSTLIWLGAMFAGYVTGIIDYLVFGRRISKRALRRELAVVVAGGTSVVKRGGASSPTVVRLTEAFLHPTTQKWGRWVLFGTAVFVIFGWIVAYLKSVVYRADDTFIGLCEVPLEILLDQREHALCLKLHNPYQETRKGRKEVAKTPKNVSGQGQGSGIDTSSSSYNTHRGILRVKLSMSE